jgi:hypothetical protein
MLRGKVLTMEEGTHKYRTEKDKKEPLGKI